MGLIATAKALIIDGWSWLNYKPVFNDAHGTLSRRVFLEAQVMWVPDQDAHMACASPRTR